MPPPQEIERMEEQKLKSKFPGAPGKVFGWWMRDCWQRQDSNGWTGLGGRPGLGGSGGHSAFLQVNFLSQSRVLTCFLQKRLGKGQKFFDSGDYQMAKQVFLWFVKVMFESCKVVELFSFSCHWNVIRKNSGGPRSHGGQSACLGSANRHRLVSPKSEPLIMCSFLQEWLILPLIPFQPGKAPSSRYQNIFLKCQDE